MPASAGLSTSWYITQPWGYLDVAAVLRPTLQIKDGMFVDRSFVGYGVHFSGDVKPGWFGWSKDYITFQFEWGDGIGRYVAGNSSEFSLITNYPTTTIGAGLTHAAGRAAAHSLLARTPVS